MSGYNWTWPQIPSLTAMKYQRHGYVETRPFQLGERMCGRRGLERFVKGYRYKHIHNASAENHNLFF